MGIFNRLVGAGGAQPPPEDQTETILGKYLDRDFRVFPMAEARQSAERLDAIGRKHSVVYPAEFYAHVCGRFPGIFVEAKEEVWPRNKEYDIGPFWSFLYGLHTYTPAAESEPWMRLDDAAASFRADTSLHAAPILCVVADADLYCVTEEGKLAQYRHEINELEPLDLTFWQLFEREVSALRARKDKKKATRPAQ